MKIHLSNQDKINDAIKELADIVPNGEYEIEIKKLPKSRTCQQNKALHLYCKLLADELKKSFTVQQVLEQSVEREWDMDNVKNLLWRPIQIAITGKESTAEQQRAEYLKIHKYLEHFIGSKFGIYVPWPIKKDKKICR